MCILPNATVNYSSSQVVFFWTFITITLLFVDGMKHGKLVHNQLSPNLNWRFPFRCSERAKRDFEWWMGNDVTAHKNAIKMKIPSSELVVHSQVIIHYDSKIILPKFNRKTHMLLFYFVEFKSAAKQQSIKPLIWNGAVNLSACSQHNNNALSKLDNSISKCV